MYVSRRVRKENLKVPPDTLRLRNEREHCELNRWLEKYNRHGHVKKIATCGSRHGDDVEIYHVPLFSQLLRNCSNLSILELHFQVDFGYNVWNTTKLFPSIPLEEENLDIIAKMSKLKEIRLWVKDGGKSWEDWQCGEVMYAIHGFKNWVVGDRRGSLPRLLFSFINDGCLTKERRHYLGLHGIRRLKRSAAF